MCKLENFSFLWFLQEENAWGKTRTPEYIAKFPTNLAPSIEHGSVYVTEGGAILRYLACAFPDKAGSAYPEDAQTRANVDMLVDYTNTGICSLIPKSVYATFGFPGNPGDVMSLDETKEFSDVAKEACGKAIYETLESKYGEIFLKDTKFLLSDSPTIADFRFAPMLNFIKVATKLPDRIVEYEKAMNELPGYTEACAGVVEFASPSWKK